MTVSLFLLIVLIGLWLCVRLDQRAALRQPRARRAVRAKADPLSDEAIRAAQPAFDEAKAWERILVTQEQVAERFAISPELLAEFAPERLPCPKTGASHAWPEVEPRIRVDGAPPPRTLQRCPDCEAAQLVDTPIAPDPRENLLTRGQAARKEQRRAAANPPTFEELQRRVEQAEAQVKLLQQAGQGMARAHGPSCHCQPCRDFRNAKNFSSPVQWFNRRGHVMPCYCSGCIGIDW